MPVTQVTDPHGVEWVVRRRWLHRRLRWRGRRSATDLANGADIASLGSDLPVVGVILAGVSLLLLAIALVVFVIPAVIFVVEVLVVVVIGGVGVAGRVLFGRPWTVEARADDGQLQEWQVTGWRASGEQVDAVATALRTTGRPPGTTPGS